MSNANGTDAGEKIVAFLDLAEFEDGGAIRGGCLVTDAVTRPLEFRVSGAIRPTKVQRTLYGETLHEYICIDLIGLPMLQSLDSKPEFVLVRDAEFLKLRPKIEFPILWLRGTAEGQFMLQAFPGCDDEAEAARDGLPRQLRGRKVMEPFMRIRNALEQAHSLGVGDERKT